jgi:ribonuclease VapC|tara:strand:- start:509 stop:913 length:405 start_codon:yes stop_codon:yes gene_type:complete
MIVVDTSALIAIITSEPMSDKCSDVLNSETSVIMSAGTLTEFLIVARRRKLWDEAEEIIALYVGRIIEVTPKRAKDAAAAYALWGKSFHPAGLNFGDCFAYATAKEFDCPLLYVGNDFAQTDVRAALAGSSSPM